MKSPSRIILLGPMGCGKSTVGRKLAKKIGWKFVDTDEWIEARSKMTVAGFFAKKGEDAFRKMEGLALSWALSQEKSVISVGGGMVVNALNRKALFQGGLTFYLFISPERALKRLGNKGKLTRPLLGGDALGTLTKLARVRRAWYMQAAFKISALGTPEAIASRIVRRARSAKTLP